MIDGEQIERMRLILLRVALKNEIAGKPAFTANTVQKLLGTRTQEPAALLVEFDNSLKEAGLLSET